MMQAGCRFERNRLVATSADEVDYHLRWRKRFRCYSTGANLRSSPNPGKRFRQRRDVAAGRDLELRGDVRREVSMLVIDRGRGARF